MNVTFKPISLIVILLTMEKQNAHRSRYFSSTVLIFVLRKFNSKIIS